MANAWKSFDFFEASQVKPGDDETRIFFESNEIASVCSGSDSLFLGSFDGYVRIVGPSWKVLRSFPAYEVGSITHMRQVEGTSLLVTVAEDLSTEPVLKVWALDKPVKKTGLPTCLSTIQINNGKKQFPISAFTTTADLSQLAVGFANGSVTLIRGDLVNDTGTRQRIIYESEEPVTGVELDVDESRITTLFIATTARILKLPILANGKAQASKTVEEAGCGVGCMTVDRRTGEIVVARDDAIYYYSLERRGAPRAFDVPKNMVAVYNDYVALVSPGPTNASGGGGLDGGGGGGGGSGAAARRRFGVPLALSSSDALFHASTLRLLETELKVVAHTETLLSPVKAVFELWGSLCVLTMDGKVRRYQEKTLAQRLAMLYQRDLYHLAIELARKAGMDSQQQEAIFRRFGDYLYSKGSYDDAMAQYIRAIDSTEPSQVIRKFLDTQRIHNLIDYLEELHEHHRATADHTTLLLNCYAKLKDVGKLEAFIKAPGDLKFDLDTAIAMCRQSGYYDQAVYLAKQHNEYDLVIDTLVEDAKQYDDALDCIWQLDPETAYACLMKYARVLIDNCPQKATQLFIEYYTGRYKPRPAVAEASGENAAAAAAAAVSGGFVQNLAGYISLPYLGSSGTASPAVPGASSGPGGPKAATGGAPSAALAAATPTPSKDGQDAQDGKGSESDSAPLYRAPRPRSAFSSFIDHPDEFIVFLEACLREDGVSSADRTDLYTTLFEIYLAKAAEKKGEHHREEWEAKAKALISQRRTEYGSYEDSNSDDSDDNNKNKKGVPIARANVLLLSHLSGFREGTTLVKEQAGLLFDIFRTFTATGDTRGALRALHKYGPEEPRLYPAALLYLTSSAQALEEAGPGELAAVLERIDRDGLMAPLQVVQTLSQNTVATMGMVKPYLQAIIERERRAIAANKRRIAAFRSETDQHRTELADLAAKPAVFQATRCSQCALPLELPVVHFLCKHSFHQRCLKSTGDDAADAIHGPATECPLCAQENATVRAIRHQQDEYATRHDLFQAELANSDDRFGTVADWFQRGVMRPTGE